MKERWREGQTPTRRGPWKMLQVAFKARGWYVRIWQDVKIADMEVVEVWGEPPLVGLLMRRDGERVGLLYDKKPTHLKEKK